VSDPDGESWIARAAPGLLLVMALLLASLASFHLYQRVLKMGAQPPRPSPMAPAPPGASR